MTIRVYEKKNRQTNWITRFLVNHQVQHQLVTQQEIGALSPRATAAVEVDGHLFIDPNEDFLKKILHVD